MYIPYLYFNVKPANKEIEKSCIEIVTKGQKDLSKYIQSVINKETEFFIIDAKFGMSGEVFVDGLQRKRSRKKPKYEYRSL